MIGRISFALVFSIIVGSLFTATPHSASSRKESDRTIPIVFAGDDTVRGEPVWRGNIERMVREAGRYYGSRFALVFETAEVVSWPPPPRCFGLSQ
jgi:hypothetical protein